MMEIRKKRRKKKVTKALIKFDLFNQNLKEEEKELIRPSVFRNKNWKDDLQFYESIPKTITYMNL